MRRGSRTGRVALLAVAVALFTPGVHSSAATHPPGAMPIASLGRIVPVPIPQAFVNRAGAHLTYYGGPVMAFTENAIVLWGGTGHTNALTSGLPGFFTSLASTGNGNAYDAALEYGTRGLGTDQPLTLASRYLGSFTISPSTSSTNLTDTQIASELVAQIGAGAQATLTLAASTWTVQRQWSNAETACIVSHLSGGLTGVAADFTPVAASGAPTAFDASATTSPNGGGLIASYSWDWGDGTSSTGSAPVVSHAYATPGTRLVSMVATDAGGVSGAKFASVTTQNLTVPTLA